MPDWSTARSYTGDPLDLLLAVDDLLELLNRPAWHRDASCREHPEVKFFIEHGSTAEAARAVGAGCLVRRECLDAALAVEGTDGVWGGTTVGERKALRVSPAA